MQAPRVRGPPPCWYRHAPGFATQAVAPMCSDPLPICGPGSGAADPGLKPTVGRLFPAPRPPSIISPGLLHRVQLHDPVPPGRSGGALGGNPVPTSPQACRPRGGVGEKHRLAVVRGVLRWPIDVSVSSPTVCRLLSLRSVVPVSARSHLFLGRSLLGGLLV